MNSNYSTYNTIRQHFRNAISSKLFLAVTICATVFTSFITASFILEMIEAGFYGHAPSILNIVFPILSIVGTVGLYCTRSAVRNDDSARVVSSLTMTKCFTAMLKIVLVIGYIISSLMILLSVIWTNIKGFLYDIIDSAEYEDYFSHFGDYNIYDYEMTWMIFVCIIIAGIILLTICILANVYQHGISKAIKSAQNSEMTVMRKPSISSFSIVFGYILGVIIALGGLTFDYVYGDPLYVFQNIFDSCASISLGTGIFILSLTMSKLKSNLSTASFTPSYEKHCTSCGAVIPGNAEYCMRCGSGAKQAAPINNAPVDSETPEKTVQNATTDPAAADDSRNAHPHAFCSNCGKPISDAQTFCGNCGFKLK